MPRLRSRLRARLVLAGLSACGLAALAWASFVPPLPRLIYNPSDSVAVGWYRVEPLSHRADSLQPPLSVGSIVVTHLPANAATLAAQRGYLPAHIPLLKRVGAVAPQHVCIIAGQVRIRSEEHTSELQSLISISYAVFCLKKKHKPSY